VSGLEHYLSIFTKAVFIENIVLAYFLGLCSFLAISKNINASVGIGMAKGALVWISEDFKNTDLGFLKLIVFISVIAAMVQLVEMFMERFSQSLYNSLGIFLPLIAVNCSILGGSLFMVEREYTISETVVYGFGSGVGFFLAIVALASIRYRIRYSNIPPRLQGVGMAMLLTGLLSMAFMAFSGIDL